MTYSQQGDCLLFSEAIPTKLKTVKGDLLHKGQQHHHRLSGGKFKILTDGTNRFIQVDKATKLVHEEHNPISLAKGQYRLGLVQEYDHFTEEARAVID